MKTKVKKFMSMKSIPLLVLALLIVFGTALAASHEPVSGTGEAFLDIAALPPQANGTVNLIIGGEEFPASFTLSMSDMAWKDGVLHVTASHTFTFCNGTITTTDKGIGEPTETPGLLTLNENLTIVSGTDDLEGACGELRVHGQIQFVGETTAQVSFEVRGAICR